MRTADGYFFGGLILCQKSRNIPEVVDISCLVATAVVDRY